MIQGSNAIIFSLIILMLLVVIALIIYSNLKKNPNKIESLKDLYAEGLDMMVSGKRKSAYRNFKTIINRDSNNVRAYLHLGQVLRESGKIKNALKIHNNLLFRTDLSQYEKVELYKNLVFNYEELNNIIESINYCNKILEIDKNNDWAIKYIIKLYRNKDDWSNAIKYLNLYFKKNNKNDSHMLALYEIQRGRSILKNEDFDKARNIFEGALELDENLYIIYYFIGNTYKAESNFKFNRAIELSKIDNADTLENIELIETCKKDAQKLLGKAIPMWIHFIEYMPHYSWVILPTLKDALQALDRYGDLEKVLIKIKNKDSSNVDIISHLADFYANKGEIDKALETINLGLDKNANSLIAQLKKIKIKSLINKQLDLSSEVDKLIQSLLRDERYKKYRHNFSDNDLNWIFKYGDKIYED